MSVTINGTNGLVFSDNSTQASAQVGMKNRIIDGGFIINQRGYVSNTALSSGVYAHDRWKAGSGGCTYTFTQAAAGVNTTITITAGTLVQVIEGCNLPEGGTYVLSWTGTAQGRLNGGSYGASGSITVTGWTAGTNLNVEFNTGTLGSVQLEKGSTATSFDYRPYGQELALCQRYLPAWNDGGRWIAVGDAANVARFTLPFEVQTRVPPTGVSTSAVSVFSIVNVGPPSSLTFLSGSSNSLSLTVGYTGLTAGTVYQVTGGASTQILGTGCEL